MRPSLLAVCVVLSAPALRAEPAYLELYLALGEPGAVQVEGRVLAGTPLPPEEPGDWALVNALRVLAAVESDELPGVELEIAPRSAADGAPVRVTTDGEGFFHAVLDARPGGRNRAGTVPLALRLRSPEHSAPELRGDATVLPPENGVVLVTDFDDTLAISHVARPLVFALQLLAANGSQQGAVPGAAECLRTLSPSLDGVVVLSGSPVNFHPRLEAFLDSHGFPAAWFLLRDFGVGPEADSLDVGRYKRDQLDRLAERLPHTRFVLLGDATEKDPETYAEFRAAQPDRVLHTWIRDPEAPAAAEQTERFSDFGRLGGGCGGSRNPLAAPPAAPTARTP